LLNSLRSATDATDRHSDHVTTLSSVDDGLSDELQVFWNLESDADVLERATLPRPQRDRFDEPERLHTFLRWRSLGALASTDGKALQSLFPRGITIEDYHHDPVVRASRQAAVNLFIADSVGGRQDDRSRTCRAGDAAAAPRAVRPRSASAGAAAQVASRDAREVRARLRERSTSTRSACCAAAAELVPILSPRTGAGSRCLIRTASSMAFRSTRRRCDVPRCGG